MEQKYLDMLIAIDKSIKERQDGFDWGLKLGLPLPQKTTGYRIRTSSMTHDDFFEQIDWLAENGYITIGTGPYSGEWCDITDSYVETYKLTDLGIEMVGRK